MGEGLCVFFVYVAALTVSCCASLPSSDGDASSGTPQHTSYNPFDIERYLTPNLTFSANKNFLLYIILVYTYK